VGALDALESGSLALLERERVNTAVLCARGGRTLKVRNVPLTTRDLQPHLVMANLSNERRRTLRLLARRPKGCTEAVLVAHGFPIEMLEELVSSVDAKTDTHKMIVAGRPVAVAWPQITAARVARRNEPWNAHRKTTICLRFDARVLASIDADAKRMGITRIAWLHVAADERLEGGR
jgi:hypothetical protein